MELWVRSQDKTELVKVNNLANIDYRIVFINNGNGRATLGTYKTKERALEVLDEISEILQLKLCSTLGTFEEVFKGYPEEQLKIVLKQMAVYEMPKE